MKRHNKVAKNRNLPSDVDHSGRNFDERELENLRSVLNSGTLNCTKGTWVKSFEEKFCEQYGVNHARSVTSGKQYTPCFDMIGCSVL